MDCPLTGKNVRRFWQQPAPAPLATRPRLSVTWVTAMDGRHSINAGSVDQHCTAMARRVAAMDGRHSINAGSVDQHCTVMALRVAAMDDRHSINAGSVDQHCTAMARRVAAMDGRHKKARIRRGLFYSGYEPVRLAQPAFLLLHPSAHDAEFYRPESSVIRCGTQHDAALYRRSYFRGSVS